MTDLQPSLDALEAAFNRGSLDVPAGLFSPRTAYRLNGRPYEVLLGGSEGDPLIRLLARGVAGYRTAARALQYTLVQPTIRLTVAEHVDVPGTFLVTARVAGQLRDVQQPFAFDAEMRIETGGEELTLVAASCPEDVLVRLAEARRA